MKRIVRRFLAQFESAPVDDLVLLEHAADILILRGYPTAAEKMNRIVALERSAAVAIARCEGAAESKNGAACRGNAVKVTGVL